MREKAIIVGVNINDRNFEYSMEELNNLATGFNIDVVVEVTQKLNRVNSTYYIGKGKLEELVNLIDDDIDVVIFNDELSQTQIRNLESILECRVIDRTLLILDIFSDRAKTKEAQLQIEIARLQYMLPRLSGFGKHLERQRGGGVNNKGSGEKKLELDHRRIEDRIKQLSRELDSIIIQRETQRRLRKKAEIPIVSLVGYTNAGKSTILNSMVDIFNLTSSSKVFEKDMLFATLNTSVRNIKLSNNKLFLLTDTVGFISKLPHNLISAFRSTLEEVIEADLLIHVVDCSNPSYKQHIEITNNTLKEIGVKDIPIIISYNKADLINERTENNGVYISAKEKNGLDELTQMVSNIIFKDYVKCEMLIPYNKGSLISYLNDNANIYSTSYEYNGAKLALECSKSDYEKYQDYIIVS